MNKLPPGAASLLAQARERDRAQHVDLDATLQKLHATLPFAAVGPVSVPSADAGADLVSSIGQPASLPPPSLPPATGMGALSGGTLLSGKAVKVFLATVALGGAIGGASLLGVPAQQADSRAHETPAQVASRSPQTSRAARATEDESASRETVAPARGPSLEDKRAPARPRPPRAARVPSSVEPSAGAATPGAVAASAEAAAVPPTAPVVAEPSEEVAPRASAAEQRGESELDLIDAALAQLRAGSGRGALTLLQRHAERYPHGRFRTEREGLRVLALCESGDLAQGRDAQTRFLRSAGDAPIAARVRAACVEKAAR